MATTRKSSKGKSSSHLAASHRSIPVRSQAMPSESSSSTTDRINELKQRFFSPERLLIGLFLAAVVVYLVLHPALLIVATVNNQPIWRWDFEKRAVSRVGKQVTDELVNESLIMSEARSRGIQTSEAEIDARIKEIEKGLGGTPLSEVLTSQGMSLEELKRQLRLQMIAEKMIADKIRVTDEEVASYLEQNRSFLTATDEASLTTEAQENLRQEKLGAEFQNLFEELKAKAAIRRFL